MKRTDITAIFPEATAEQIDQLLNINGGDINKAKGNLEALQAELDGLKAKPANNPELDALRAELDGLKNANALRDLREQVSKDTGVPASLLTGDTEDACKAQAEAIKSYADSTSKAPGYPGLKDGGEVRAPSGTATRDKFAAWFNESMS